MSTAELKWLPIPLDLWVPAGLKDFQEGWFINLLRASLRSEYLGYLILCEEGCSGCPACLWRVANAHHPEHFKKHSSLVLACFNRAQIAGHRVLYFPKLVEKVNKQLSRIKNHHSRRDDLSETSTKVHRNSGNYSPSDSLFFDFDLDSKKQNPNTSNTRELPIMISNWSDEHAQKNVDVQEGATRILRILDLPEVHLRAAMAAVEGELKRTRLSMDGIVQRITTEANHAARIGTSQGEFLQEYLAQASARRLLEVLNLPVTNNFVYRISAVLKAEARDTGLPIEDTAHRITQLASEDRQRGEKVDIFYFEDVRWRSSARVDKAERRKLDNLEVNAKVKQRIRARLGAS
jgi:hypothetical protein